jgi:hypothetical protein
VSIKYTKSRIKTCVNCAYSIFTCVHFTFYGKALIGFFFSFNFHASASSRQDVASTMTERAYQLLHDNATAHSLADFSSKASHHFGLLAPLQPRFGSLRLLDFPKTKIVFEREEICEYDGHTVRKLSHRHLTAD